MLDSAEIGWLKSTANELNNLLQVISDSVELMATLREGDPERARCVDMVYASVHRAARITGHLLGRAGEYEQEAVHPPSPTKPPEKTFSPPPAFDEIPIANPGGTKELILVVDDEEFVAMLAKRVLTDAGYRVVMAKDGMEAIDIYKKLKNQIALVILDFTMPIMDGADVFDELRRINPRVPVMLSSGFAEQEKLRSMLAKGLRGFMPKPYSQEKLLLQVRSTLDSLRAQQGR